LAERDEVQTLQDQIVSGAEKALLQAKEGYQAGNIGFLDLLDARQTFAEGRLSLLELLKDMSVTRANLRKIVERELEE
jgi:cobalt-zinc-cadmium efflux system outer membrane protein